MTTTEVRSRNHRSARAVGWAVAAVVALVIVTLAVVAFVLPAAAGGTARSVQTGSMAPALPVGSLIIDRPVDPAALHVGDIATYREHADGRIRYVTHRVVGVAGPLWALRFTFRGDDNNTPDPRTVPASAIAGKVWIDIPYVGAVSDGLARMRGTLIGLAVLALAAFSAWQIAAGLHERQVKVSR